MGSPYPVLYNGLATSQGIYDASSTAVVPVGTRGALQDGRAFYYARSSGAGILAPGKLLSCELASADLDDQVTDTHAVGEKVIGLTSVNAYTANADDLAGGYLQQQLASTTGIGQCYKIKSSSAITAAAAYTVTLFDGLAVAFAAAAKCTVTKNPWMDAIVMSTTGVVMCVGVSNVSVPVGSTTPQYYWCQTWGVASVLCGAANVLGDELMRDVGGGAVAGATLIGIAGDHGIGTSYQVGVDTNYAQTFLRIAP